MSLAVQCQFHYELAAASAPTMPVCKPGADEPGRRSWKRGQRPSRVDFNACQTICEQRLRVGEATTGTTGLSALGAASRSGARCTRDFVIEVSRSPIIGATRRSCPLSVTAPPASPRRVVLAASRRVCEVLTTFVVLPGPGRAFRSEPLKLPAPFKPCRC
jgi:hypothetical protein